MKQIYKINLAAILFILLMLSPDIKAGNKDRAGQAGATELLINPWARSSGWCGVNISNSTGLESIFTNVAGLAFTGQTEIVYSHTQWLRGSGISVNNFGIAQKLKNENVIGLTIMSMGFGDIPITTVTEPDGGIGTFSPKYMNINVAFAKAFSNSIYGGVNVKIISESISNLSAQGVAIDAGIQYVTGESENIKFGISLKNVGTNMRFRGDGLSLTSLFPGKNEEKFVLQRGSVDYELPTQLNIGASYAMDIDEQNKLTFAGAFISNAFFKDQFIVGAEYSLMQYLQLRAAYAYEEGIFSSKDRTTAFTGPNAGFTVQVPINKEKNSNFAIDYAYKASTTFKGTHALAIRLNF